MLIFTLCMKSVMEEETQMSIFLSEHNKNNKNWFECHPDNGFCLR